MAGGPLSQHKELLFKGPFHAADWDTDPYLPSDPSTPQDANNFYPHDGAIEPRGGLQKLVEFKQNTSGTVYQNRAFGNMGLSFLTSTSSVSGIAYNGSSFFNIGRSIGRSVDMLATGRWFTMDSMYNLKYGNPPTTWSKQRYKLIFVDGNLRFLNGSTSILDVGAAIPTGILRYWIKGGWIREFGTNANYNDVYQIVGVDTNGGAGVGIYVDRVYGGATVTSGKWVIFLPIMDTNPGPSGLDTIAPPLYYPQVDFCEMPNSQGSYYARPCPSACIGAVGASEELTPIDLRIPQTFGVVPEPGMSFRRTAEDTALETRGIVSVETNGTQVIAGRTYDRYTIWVWPPYNPYWVGNLNAEVTGRSQYFVTGAFGSTVISPGVTPIYAQSPDDDTHYMANCCAAFADRIVIGTDLSVPINTLTQDGFTAPYFHPGRVVTSSNGVYDRFDGRANIDQAQYDLGIGPIRQMFVMRETLYCLSETSIVAGRRSGIANDPIQFSPVVENERFVPWIKPLVIQGSQAVVLTESDINLFDGSTLRPVTGHASHLYRNWLATGGIQDGHVRGFYDASTGRVILTKGTQQANTEPLGNVMLVGDLDTMEWHKWSTTQNWIGGACEWPQPIIPDPSNGRYDRDTEFLCHTLSLYQGNSNNPDYIMAFRRSRGYDERMTDGFTFRQPWFYQTAYFDMGDDRLLKSVQGVRIVYEVTSTIAQTVWVSLVAVRKDAADGTPGAEKQIALSIDLSGPTVGEVRSKTWLGDQIANMPLTGYAFSLRLFGDPDTVTDTANTKRPVIREFAVIYTERAENRPN